MKLYIRTANNEPKITLRDLFSAISKIKIVSDASKVEIDGYDPYDDIYETYSDEELKELSEKDVENICRREVLARIKCVAPEKLTKYQLAIVGTIGEQIAQKYGLTDDDLDYLLQKLHSCQTLDWVYKDAVNKEKYPRTEKFFDKYDVTEAQILDLIHHLQPKDFDNTTQSTEYNNYMNALYVFYPHYSFKDKKGNIVKNEIIYLKLDYDVETSDGKIVAVMSFHKADSTEYKKLMDRKNRGIKYDIKKLNRYEDK